MADTSGVYRDIGKTEIVAFPLFIDIYISPQYRENNSSSRTTAPIAISLNRTKYLIRAWDSGNGGRYVTWLSYDTPNTTPQSVVTTPNYTGTLSAIRIECIS